MQLKRVPGASKRTVSAPPAPSSTVATVVQVTPSAEVCDGVDNDCPTDQVLDGVPCLDGDVCNGDEVCSAGICTPGSVLECDDADACTADSCHAILGCAFDPIPECGPAVPSISRIGLAVLSLQILAVGVIFLARRRRSGA